MQQPDTEISKSQRKRDATALQDMGERLVELNNEQLSRLELPTELREAVDEAKRIHARGGRKRQLQYIGKLMRNLDAAPIEQALNALELQSRESAAAFHRLERWRDRLIGEGDQALTEALNEFPHADRQHLRQLVRKARDEATSEQPPKGAAKGLFRYLRELGEA